jgi:hypothetical protein
MERPRKLNLVSYAAATVRSYFARSGRPHDQALDGYYRFEMALLRDMLDRLEIILDDEGVPRETAERVIRCMLYGAPSPAAAEERMRRENETVKLPSERPPVPFVMSADLAARLGLKPDGLAPAGCAERPAYLDEMLRERYRVPAVPFTRGSHLRGGLRGYPVSGHDVVGAAHRVGQDDLRDGAVRVGDEADPVPPGHPSILPRAAGYFAGPIRFRM